MQRIIERQVKIEVDQERFNPLAIFVEGTTSNGSCLLPFKKGAFAGMRTVIPCFVTFESGQINPFYESVQVLPLMALLFSNLQICRCTFTILPEFVPTSHMLDIHSDKGKEPWEIFAWCVRDITSKKSGLPKDDESSFRLKRQYCDFMQGKVDEVEIDG